MTWEVGEAGPHSSQGSDVGRNRRSDFANRSLLGVFINSRTGKRLEPAGEGLPRDQERHGDTLARQM